MDPSFADMGMKGGDKSVINPFAWTDSAPRSIELSGSIAAAGWDARAPTSPGGEFPRNMQVYLFAIGVFHDVPGVTASGWTRGYTCAVRLILLGCMLYLTCSITVNSLVGMDSDNERAPRWYGDFVTFECSPSSNVELGKPAPCVYFLAAYLLLPCFGISSAVIMAWLLLRLDDLGGVRSHLKQIEARTNRFALRYCVFQVFTVGMAAAGIGVGTQGYLRQNHQFIRTPGDNGRYHDVNEESTYWKNVMVKNVIVGLVVGIAMFPFSGLVFLVYTEALRLEFVLDDTVKAMRTNPLSLAEAFAALRVTVAEFENVQENYGNIMGCSLIAMVCMEVSCFIQTAYIAPLDQPNEQFFQWITLIVCSMYPLTIALRSIVNVNVKAASLKDECTSILMSIDAVAVKRSAATGNGRANKEDDDSSAVLAALGAASDAGRLAAVVDRRPLALSILGYEPNAGDVTRLIAGIGTVQLISFLGLDWILG